MRRDDSFDDEEGCSQKLSLQVLAPEWKHELAQSVARGEGPANAYRGSTGSVTLAPVNATDWDPNKPVFYFLPAKAVLACTGTSLARMQELRAAGMLVKVQVDLAEAFSGKGFILKVLFVSHRWEDKRAPDGTGAQLQAIQRHLRSNPSIQYIWFDYACMAQTLAPVEGQPDGRSTADDEEFHLMIRSITDLYLTAKVLVLLDTTYTTRFWTLMEAWCSMMTATPHGVRAARRSERRATIACIHNAAATAALSAAQIKKLVAKKSPQEMREVLASPDINVTNTKDKELMLPVVGETNEHVKRIFQSMRT